MKKLKALSKALHLDDASPTMAVTRFRKISTELAALGAHSMRGLGVGYERKFQRGDFAKPLRLAIT